MSERDLLPEPHSRAEELTPVRRNGTVEAFAKLDADQVKTHSGWRLGAVLALELSPPVEACPYVECMIVRRDVVELRYTAGGTAIYLPLCVVWKADTIAIERPYFLCPVCGSTCRSLRGPAPLFACRICNQLNYRCQQTAKTNLGALVAAKIRSQLGTTGLNIPQRPRWMRWRTYIDLVTRLLDLEAAQMEQALGRANRMRLKFSGRGPRGN